MTKRQMIGQVIGKLTVIAPAPPVKGKTWWLCGCECGAVKALPLSMLVRGATISCGCTVRERPPVIRKNRKPKVDLTGAVFNKLTVLGNSGEFTKRGETLWACRCECGRATKVRTWRLLHGAIGCRCASIERSHQSSRENLAKTPGRSAMKSVYAQYHHGAEIRNIPFLLCLDEFSGLASQSCFYCGHVPDRLMRAVSGSILHNGVDRLDSKGAYSVANCVPCCKRCNIGKNKYSKPAFLDWVKRVATHQGFILNAMPSLKGDTTL